MITGELKNKIDGLWEIFWTGGLTNPLDVIEQMTYLMFIHDIDEVDIINQIIDDKYVSIFDENVKRMKEEAEENNRVFPFTANELRWSVFRDFEAEKKFTIVHDGVFPFIKNLNINKNSTYTKYMSDAVFKIPTAVLLDKIITTMDNIYNDMKQLQDKDTRGDIYEYLLSKLSTAGVNGQFRTPRHIIRMIVELMNPKPTDKICDPACGTSGFLVNAGVYIKEKYSEIFMKEDSKDKEHYMN